MQIINWNSITEKIVGFINQIPNQLRGSSWANNLTAPKINTIIV